MRIAILSDIHGNVSALESVLNDIRTNVKPDHIALLGDLINYGMRSNEVISMIRELDIPVVCNIWGNHEQSIMEDDYAHFSTERGVLSAKYTKSQLTPESLQYLNGMEGKSGKTEFELEGKKFLAIHGSLADPYWKAIKPDNANGTDGAWEGYEGYDYVLSGHSHYTHVFDMFYKVDDPSMRNKKKVIFINPGSVGQPRNHNPKAQYAVLDTDKGVSLISVPYDVKFEQSLYNDQVDPFYSERLTNGV